MPRIAGIDLARAFAVFGMFVAHLAKEDENGWWWLADGRPSALFALLAGCGLAFMTRNAYPHREQIRETYPRILIRAVLIGILGVGLMFLETPIAVILPSYAVMFALAIPFLHLPVRGLVMSGSAVIILAPPVVQGIRLLASGSPEPAGVWVPGLFEIATGYYPAMTWVAYCLVGVAVARLPLQENGTVIKIFLIGSAAAALGYGGGYAISRSHSLSPYLTSLVDITPHTDSGFEVLGNIGVCLVVISLCLWTTRFQVLRLLLTPLTSAGSMPLTLYVGHLFFIWTLGPESVRDPTSQGPLLWLIGVSIAFAFWWRMFFSRGPLESLLTRLTTTALQQR